MKLIAIAVKREGIQIFIDGIAGRNFSKPLAFYLNESEAYLQAVEKLNSCV